MLVYTAITIAFGADVNAPAGAYAIRDPRRDHLRRPPLPARAESFIITAQPDKTAVLTTMVAHDLCPKATILTALRDTEPSEQCTPCR